MMNNRRSGGMPNDRYGIAPSAASSNTAANRRRTTSASKLSQFFHSANAGLRTSPDSLQSGLHDLSLTSKFVTKIAETQLRGANTLARWARNSQNAAIDDVMQHTCQLFQMFTEKQLQFAREYDHFLQQLQKIADADRAVKEAERQVSCLEEKERKLKKHIRKGVSFFYQRRGGDLCLLRQQLEEVIASKEAAERTLSDTRAEMEVVKMFRFRNGMQGIADSYRALGQNCQSIFNCHREITEMVPAVSNQDVRRMVYDGMPITRERVEDLRRSLESGMTMNNSMQIVSRRRSDPVRNRTVHQGTPPPPYTPTAPVEPITLPPPPPVQRTHVSDSQLLHHYPGPMTSSCSAALPPYHSPTTSSQPPVPPCRGDSHRRSTPCNSCGRMYPDLPPNPYVVMKQHQQQQQQQQQQQSLCQRMASPAT